MNHNCRETGSVRETVVADAPKAIDIRRSSLTEFESKEKELPERKEGKQDMAASVDEGSICLKEELKMTGLGPKRMRGNEEGICLDKVQNFCKRGKKYGLRERVGSSNTETTSESTTTGKRKMGDVPADEIWSAEKKAVQRGGRNEASMEPGSAKSEMTSVSMEDERTILAPRTEDGKRLNKVNRFRRWKKQTSGCVSRRFSGGSRDRRRILRDHLDLKLSKNLHNKGTQDSRGIHVEATTDIINKEVSAADGSTALNGGYSNVSNGNCDEKLVPESNNGENVSEMRSEANEKTLELINRERRHVNEQTVQEVAGEEELSACDKQQNGGDHEDIKLGVFVVSSRNCCKALRSIERGTLRGGVKGNGFKGCERYATTFLQWRRFQGGINFGEKMQDTYLT